MSYRETLSSLGVCVTFELSYMNMCICLPVHVYCLSLFLAFCSLYVLSLSCVCGASTVLCVCLVSSLGFS